jgi:hypothetical protein
MFEAREFVGCLGNDVDMLLNINKPMFGHILKHFVTHNCRNYKLHGSFGDLLT